MHNPFSVIKPRSRLGTGHTLVVFSGLSGWLFGTNTTESAVSFGSSSPGMAQGVCHELRGMLEFWELEIGENRWSCPITV